MLACQCTIFELTKWLVEILNCQCTILGGSLVEGLWLVICLLRIERVTTYYKYNWY